MGTPTTTQQADFDQRFMAAYDDYTTTFTHPALSGTELKRIIKKHQLVRHGKLLSHKQFSALLLHYHLPSREAWRIQMTEALFEAMSKAGMKQATITRMLSDALHISYTHAQRKIRKLRLVARHHGRHAES